MQIDNRMAVANQILAAAKAVFQATTEERLRSAADLKPTILNGEILATEDSAVVVGTTFGVTVGSQERGVLMRAQLILTDPPHRYALRFFDFPDVPLRVLVPDTVFIEDRPDYTPQAATA